MSTATTGNTTLTQQTQKPSGSNGSRNFSQKGPSSKQRPGSFSKTSNPPAGTGKRKRNRHSRGGKGKLTGNRSQSKRNGGKPVVRRGPELEYISVCCKERAIKPRCGQKVQVRDPETGKQKDAFKGLGHWRCSGCKKACKVTPRKPQPKEETNGNAGTGNPAATAVPVSA